MLGIWGSPQTTAERFTSDGFIRTRDLGYVDADGFVYLSDRKEDMIISGGFNIWPAEVENALYAHPAVLEAMVIGVPHEKWGETPLGVVVLRDGYTATEYELIDWCREQIGSVKKPTRIEFRTGGFPSRRWASSCDGSSATRTGKATTGASQGPEPRRSPGTHDGAPLYVADISAHREIGPLVP